MVNGFAVAGKQGLIHFGAAIPEHNPLVANFLDGIKVKGVGKNAFGGFVRLGHQFAKLIGYELS